MLIGNMEDKKKAHSTVVPKKDQFNATDRNKVQGKPTICNVMQQPHIKLHKDTTETSSHQHNTSQVSSNQSHPKKKGGFVITSVKDSVDGDESADDLDESHASYSDVSYSRATDIDRDEESSTSDEVINSTVQDGPLPASSATNHVSQSTSQVGIGKDYTKQISETSTQVSFISITSQDIKNHGEVSSQSKTDLHQEVHLDKKSFDSSTILQTTKATTAANGQHVGTSQSQVNHSQQSSQFKAPISHKASNIVNVCGASASTTTTHTITKSSSTSSTIAKSAPRIYKVVKRETVVPVERESSRWTCYDYGDARLPSIGLVPSSSDSRINAYDHVQLFSPAIPLSISATSVPSSASAYSLQHSDSASSIQRDHFVPSAASSATIQHSTSSSSVNAYDADGRKLPKTSKNDLPDNSTKTSQSNLDDSSTLTNVRIDNKIEAAMDLVKKHLMLAVRDEVDELKEKIVELEQEIDIMKGILTPEQMAQIQPVLNKASKLPQMPSSHFQSQSQIQAQSGTHTFLPAHNPDAVATSQSQSFIHQGQIQTHLMNSSSRVNLSAAIPNQTKPLLTNSIGITTSSTPLNQQQASSQSQQAARPAAYQQSPTNFQPAQPPSTTAPAQLTAQQIQALRQQTYQHGAVPPTNSQTVYQSSQVVMPQSNSQPNQAAPSPANHTFHPANAVPTTLPITSQGLNQFVQSGHQNASRLPTQAVPASNPTPARSQAANPSSNTTVASHPPMQTQNPLGTSAAVFTPSNVVGYVSGEVKIPKT